MPTGPQDLLTCLAKIEELPVRSRGRFERQFQRFSARSEVELTSMDRRSGAPALNVQLRDLSRGGISFLSAEPVEINSTWRVAFLNSGYVLGTQGIIVRHCRVVQSGAHLVGAQFCIETGLMYLLGIAPSSIRDGDNEKELGTPAFLSPNDMTH